MPASHRKKGPSAFKVLPHEGQYSGILTKLSEPSRMSKFTLVICGMTSPALLTKTVSFTFISSLFNSSILCKVTFEIFAPDIKTGSIVA